MIPKQIPQGIPEGIPQRRPARDIPYRALSLPCPCRATSLAYGKHVVLPTVDRNLQAVDVHARRTIQPVGVDELAPLAIWSAR